MSYYTRKHKNASKNNKWSPSVLLRYSDAFMLSSVIFPQWFRSVFTHSHMKIANKRLNFNKNLCACPLLSAFYFVNLSLKLTSETSQSAHSSFTGICLKLEGKTIKIVRNISGKYFINILCIACVFSDISFNLGATSVCQLTHVVSLILNDD